MLHSTMLLLLAFIIIVLLLWKSNRDLKEAYWLADVWYKKYLWAEDERAKLKKDKENMLIQIKRLPNTVKEQKEDNTSDTAPKINKIEYLVI